MQLHDALITADNAVAGNPDRAATAIVHDSPDSRIVVFRLDAGQTVPLHSSTSSVTLSVIRGSGIISGPVDGVVKEHAVHTGNVATYEPGELHGMHADAGTFVVLATIAPRPGTPRGAQAA